jgi:RNA polymerase sigma-70 factor (ECF subfamily)
LTDAELLLAAQGGDQSAFRALYQRYLPTVWRYAYAQTRGDVHTAEDLVSETFLALVRAIGKLDAEKGPLASWLMAVLRNKLGDQRRRIRAGPGAGPLEGAVEAVTGRNCDPAENAARRELVAMVMQRLPDDERLVLEWKYLENQTVREMAHRLGRTEKAVESVLYRARRSFKSWSHRLGGTDICSQKK